MAFERLTLKVEDGLARLEFNNAVRGNPIDEQFCAETCEAATRLSVDPAVRCVLITALGDAFGYGGDITSFVDDLDSLPANIKRWTTTLHSGIARLQRMDSSEEHTPELPSLMRISYAVFCLKKKNNTITH